ncbi:nucleoside diphosphate kinase regulator [Enhydrobacter sp.]|jgi:regulator of nucleoside diphosphate kinase|uniref:nucleoside diphosphate kinase regulator n=1 Tax=Enhydrobacter sp. TaxID=1894999 RepID=UPI00260F3F3F|nr:nucleoside diphosphate kinase regulator [Enhydrobacter sp.]WIM09920.1 MAG: Regulator of nucleoside diphosphate kinase [Enhydrobacter sp.]
MTEFNPHRRKPKIIVSDIDYKRLAGLAAAAQARLPEVADVLQSELERAQVVATDCVPSDVVRMGSAVEFRSDNGQQRCVTLVFPGEENISQGRISVLTPIGAALIGLSPGQSITWTTRDGRQHELTVMRVEQPEPLHAAHAS